MAQVADREAQMEHDLIDTYDAYELDYTPRPDPKPHPARPISPLLPAPASRRRSRGR
ncbi:hypothetical protein [Streptomyces sp. H39-C1]|uniref:hypothetical protein n=1 Tax=Streptomyces sp. H39-C1 TaxID=3004355 RepID=UPI0022AE6DC9|nr:hypothetical protein [Streptomyces sp. H39-C1]MCZ4101291.1 hypothetical protein [Streptomyces sp. H39-C1]